MKASQISAHPILANAGLTNLDLLSLAKEVAAKARFISHCQEISIEIPRILFQFKTFNKGETCVL